MVHAFVHVRCVRWFAACCFAVGLGLATENGSAEMTPGPVELQSTGPMTFATDGVLLVGDPKAATIYALQIESNASVSGQLKQIADLKQAIADAASADADSVSLGDLAVDSQQGTIVISATLGDQVRLFHVTASGSIQPIDLDKIAHATKRLPDAPEDKMTGDGRRRKNLRMESITDLAFFDGKVMVSGLTSSESPSSVREFSFPFADNTIVTNVEIYHAAHGRLESPAIRTFVPMTIDGQPTLLAGFTCTPLVRFPIDELNGADKVRGTTVAELGNWNSPIDLIGYEKDGKSHLLMSNTARGVMKISTDNIQAAAGLDTRVENGGTAGQDFQTIESLDGVVEMAKLGEDRAVVIIGKPDETQRLVVVELP